MSLEVENTVCSGYKLHMHQKVERYVIRKSNANWQACHRLCSLSRKLGNCAVYLLRHRYFDKEPVFTRQELDAELKRQYFNDYRAMPSAASAQRQGQVIAKQFKGDLPRQHPNTSSIPKSSAVNRNFPATKGNIESFMSGATATGYAITN